MQYRLRTRTVAFVILGGVVAAMVLGQWIERPRALLVPLLAAYFLLTLGVVVRMDRDGSAIKATRLGATLAWLSVIAGWAWCLFAGGGGFGLLVIRGPWPPTNGWFALLSGLAACPLVGHVLRNSAHLRVSARHQFGAAALLVAVGRIALTIWPQPHPL
jgi:hypothetical protein